MNAGFFTHRLPLRSFLHKYAGTSLRQGPRRTPGQVWDCMGGSPVGSDGKESTCDAGDPGLIPGSDPLEKRMATHPSILARKIPWTEEPGGL